MYATLDDVQRRMPQFALTSITKPTLEQAQTFLDDAHASLDAALTNLGYVVPVSGQLSVPQCREAVCDRTICRILYARAAAVGTDAALQSADAACKRYDAFLTALADENSPIELVDAESTDDPKPGSAGPFGYPNSITVVEPRITICSRTNPMRDW